MKKAKIDLVYHDGIRTGYQVVRLVNCATFTTYNGNLQMIGSFLDPREAEMIARDKKFDVSITQAK